MALPLIFEEIERSLYEAIRVIAVAEGYTPDVENFVNNEAGYDAYMLELASIKSSKGFAIEVFNNSQPEQKGMIETSRISIAHGGTPSGDIGLPVQKDYENHGQTQGLVVGTTMTNFYMYDVYLTCRNLKEFRVTQGIVMQALPSRSWINFINQDPEDRFLNIMTAGYASPSELRGVKEFTYSYYIPDVLTSLYTEAKVIPVVKTYSLDLINYLGI